MNLDDLDRIVDECRVSAFRLEALPQYLVPEEEEAFAEWRATGRKKRRTPANDAWLAELQEIVARGVRWYRVRILDYPLSDYSRFELDGYRDSDAAGQETFVADRAEHSELAEMHEEFWLYDDEIAVRMVYDDEGHFLRPEKAADIDACRAMRDIALRCSEPLESYLARREPKLTG